MRTGLPATLYVITGGTALAAVALGLWAMRFSARLDAELVRAARAQSEVLARDFGEEFAVQHRLASARIFESIALDRSWTAAEMDTVLAHAEAAAACHCQPAYLATGAFLWSSTRPHELLVRAIPPGAAEGLRQEVASRAQYLPGIGPLTAAGIATTERGRWPAGSAVLLLKSDPEGREVFGLGLFQRMMDGTVRAIGFVGNAEHPWTGFLPLVVEKVAAARLGPRHAELASWRVVRPAGDTLFALGEPEPDVPPVIHRFWRQQFVSDSFPQRLSFLDDPAVMQLPESDPRTSPWYVSTQVSPAAMAEVLYGSNYLGLWVVLLLVSTSLALGASMLYVARRLVQHVAEREAFATAVAHDLRTPLTQILLHAESLHLGRAAEGTRREAARVIAREARRLVHLVENAMTFVRRKGSPPRLAFTSLDPARVIEDALAAFAPTVTRAGMHVRVDLVRGLSVMLDSDAFTQVLGNLLENAVRFGAAGQVISITMTHHAGTAVVSIEDQGPGIPHGEREEVFRPFVRGRASGGTGIGLAVTRQLVELMNGRIAFADPHGAEGARVVLEFPLSGIQGAPTPPLVHEAPSHGGITDGARP